MTDQTNAISRVRAYIAAYDDAPNWGGPTMYPAPPRTTDLRTLLALAETADARVGIPDGYKLAPVEATEAMIDRIIAIEDETGETLDCDRAYRIMLAAAPEPTAPQGDREGFDV